MPMYREGEYAAGATTRKGNVKKAAKTVNKALAKSAAQKKAAAAKKKAASAPQNRRQEDMGVPSRGTKSTRPEDMGRRRYSK
jgi:hypothetical protein